MTTDSPPEEGRKNTETETLTVLQTLVRGISKKYGMRVDIGQGNKNYFNWEDVRVVIGSDDLVRDPEEWMGICCHEAEHVDITRPQVIPMVDLKERGFNGLFQTLEDTRVNTGIEKKFPGAGEWVRRAVREESIEGGRLNLQKATKKISDDLGFIPRTVQFTIALQNSWAWGEYHIPLSTDVETALARTREYAETYRNNIPETDDSEQVKQQAALDNYLLLKKYILPVFKELIDRDKGDLEILELIKFLASEKGDLERQIIELELTDEEKEEFGSIVEEAKRAADETKAKEAAEKQEVEPKMGFIDISSISEGLKQKLAIAKDQIKSESKKQLDDEVQKKMDELEDAIVEALRAKLIDPHSEETNEEREEREQMETLIQESGAGAEETQSRQAAERENQRSEYDKILSEVLPEINGLVERLEHVLVPNKFPRWKKGHPTGEKINLLGGMEYEADKSKYNKLFERKTVPEKKDYGFTLLVDMSGSMEGERLENAIKAVVIFSETLDRLGINFEIIGYHDEEVFGERQLKTDVLKDFHEQYDHRVKEAISHIKVIRNWWTPTGQAIRMASERLSDLGVTVPILINITDGSPNLGEDVPGVLGEIDTSTNQTVIGLGIGTGIKKGAIEGVYKIGKHIPNVPELPVVMGEVLEGIIA